MGFHDSKLFHPFKLLRKYESVEMKNKDSESYKNNGINESNTLIYQYSKDNKCIKISAQNSNVLTESFD